jgi:hypothetical protein
MNPKNKLSDNNRVRKSWAERYADFDKVQVRYKKSVKAVKPIQWLTNNLGRCLNEYRATVPLRGSVQDTVDYIKGLKTRPQGQGFEHRLLDNDLMEFIVTCDSSD